MKNSVILVVYERYLGDTQCGISLSRVLPEGSAVYVFDNSERPCENDAFCREQGWHYLTEGQNRGLSYAYQKCVDAMLADGFEGWLSIFDDDTEISADYFPALREAVKQNADIRLYFPMLFAGDRLISPYILPPNQRVDYFADEASCLAYRGEHFFAFNSGMAVHSSVYQTVGYRQELFLDGIDYAFLLDCYKLGFQAGALNVRMNHGFSGLQHQDYSAALHRFQIYAKDHGILFRDNLGGYRYLVGKRAVHLALIYKKATFLRVYRSNRPGKYTADTKKEELL